MGVPVGVPPTLAETRRVHVIRGLTVETDSRVRVLTGPVVGEVTDRSAVVMVEVLVSDAHENAPDTPASVRTVPIRAALYAVSLLYSNTRNSDIVVNYCIYSTSIKLCYLLTTDFTNV